MHSWILQQLLDLSTIFKRSLSSHERILKNAGGGGGGAGGEIILEKLLRQKI